MDGEMHTQHPSQTWSVEKMQTMDDKNKLSLLLFFH